MKTLLILAVVAVLVLAVLIADSLLEQAGLKDTLRPR